MALDGGDREAGDVDIGETGGAGEVRGEVAEAAAEDDERRGPGIADEGAEGGGSRSHISSPARLADMKPARLPTIMARNPYRATSARRSGAIPPMAPISTPMVMKFAKPSMA